MKIEDDVVVCNGCSTKFKVVDGNLPYGWIAIIFSKTRVQYYCPHCNDIIKKTVYYVDGGKSVSNCKRFIPRKK